MCLRLRERTCTAHVNIIGMKEPSNDIKIVLQCKVFSETAWPLPRPCQPDPRRQAKIMGATMQAGQVQKSKCREKSKCHFLDSTSLTSGTVLIKNQLAEGSHVMESYLQNVKQKAPHFTFKALASGPSLLSRQQIVGDLVSKYYECS